MNPNEIENRTDEPQEINVEITISKKELSKRMLRVSDIFYDQDSLSPSSAVPAYFDWNARINCPITKGARLIPGNSAQPDRPGSCVLSTSDNPGR